MYNVFGFLVALAGKLACFRNTYHLTRWAQILGQLAGRFFISETESKCDNLFSFIVLARTQRSWKILDVT